MASLKKRKNSKYWWAQFYVPDADGRLIQIRKSTKQTSKKKAIVVAIELERTARGVIEAGSDKARLAKAVFAEAVAELEREAFNSLSARKHFAKLLAIATNEEMTIYSVESWSMEWLRRKFTKTGSASQKRYKGHIESFLSWLGPSRRTKPLESVTSQQVREWSEGLAAEGRSGKTVLGYAKDIGAVFRAAIGEALITYNPCSSVIADLDRSDGQSRKPFSLEEVGALVTHAPNDEWRGLILVAAFTGLRLGDAARLTWSFINLDKKLITLIPSKTKRKKREIKIPLQSDLYRFLKNFKAADRSENAPVFQTLSRMPVQSQSGLSATFVSLMKQANVSRGEPSRVIKEGETKGKGRITWERGFHSFRHTFTTWLRNAGVSEEDRMALTGHSTRESHSIYSHKDEAVLKRAIDQLPILHPKSSK